MKILMDNSIERVEARSIKDYSYTSAPHGADLVLNDYPLVQWVAALPYGYKEDPVTGRLYIENKISAFGNRSMNGVYLGNFTGDEITYRIKKRYVDNNGVETFTPITDADGNDPVVPVRSFPSFGHFVRGKSDNYTDYLYTLEELNFNETYLAMGFEMEITLKTDVDLIKESTISFHLQTFRMTNFASYPEFGGSTGESMLHITGKFVDANGDAVSTSSDLLEDDFGVGSVFIFKTTPSTSLLNIGQVIEIIGDGTDDRSVTVATRWAERDVTIPNFLNLNSAVTSNWFRDSVWTSTELTALINANSGVASYSTWEALDHGLDKMLEVSALFKSIRIGLMRTGYVELFPNPQTGLSRSYKDYSVRKTLINGGLQYANRNIAKIYSGRMILDRDRVRRFLKFAEVQRAKPFPVEIITGMEEETPTVFYGHFTSPPNENISQRTGVIRDIDFSIQQIF